MPSRRRPLLVLAPWRRAPRLLLRAPGVLAAVAGAAFLLALAVASRPVFLGSAGAAAVDSDLRDGCRYNVGLQVTSGRIRREPGADSSDLASIPRRTALLNQAAGRTGLQPLVTTIAAGNAEIVSPQGERGQGAVQLFSRTGAFEHEHVHVRSRAPASEDAAKGLWLPDTTAALLHVGPGDTVEIVMADKAVPARIGAVFDDLTYVQRPKFWCSMERAFEPLGTNPLPPVALLDQPQLTALLAQAGRPAPTVMWELPPADGLSLPKAEGLANRLQRIDDDLSNTTDLANRFDAFDGLSQHIGLPGTVAHAHTVTRQVRTTADAVGTAGTAIALVAVAAAGFFWVDRRRNEVALLLAKGVGPTGLAVKAALESAVPVLLGGAAGAAVAIVAVRAFGPSAAFDTEAAAQAARLAAAASVAGLVLLAGAAGVRVRRAEQRMGGGPRHTGARVPIVLAALTAAAVVMGLVIERATGPTTLAEGGETASLGLVVVVFPLLVLVGGGGLAAVLGHWLLPRTRAMGRGWPTAPYLALRRVATAGPLALALSAGSVLSAGILLYASVVTASARATVVAKAGIGVGADMAVFLVDVRAPTAIPADLARRSTPVLRGGATTTTNESDDAPVGLLGIDRRTFGRGALYDRSFGGGSLASLLQHLSDKTDAGAMPVIAADGASLPDRFDLDTGSKPVSVQVVARARAFPGMSGEQPLLVADESVWRDHGLLGNRQLWVRGPTDNVVAQLDRARIGVVTTTVAKTNEAASSLLPLATSLGYFKALGLLGGTVTLCGAVFYLASRERARRLAGVMARGMGLTRGTARTALALELAGLLLVGLGLGWALSTWAARVAFPHLDPSPGTPPSLLFRWDLWAPVDAAAVTVVAATALAWVSERASSRRLAAEVMRDA